MSLESVFWIKLIVVVTIGCKLQNISRFDWSVQSSGFLKSDFPPIFWFSAASMAALVWQNRFFTMNHRMMLTCKRPTCWLAGAILDTVWSYAIAPHMFLLQKLHESWDINCCENLALSNFAIAFRIHAVIIPGNCAAVGLTSFPFEYSIAWSLTLDPWFDPIDAAIDYFASPETTMLFCIWRLFQSTTLLM